MAQMETRPYTGDRDYTDEEIRSFVDGLESLQNGDLTVALLVGCGQRAVAPLRDFLLNGKPRGVFQPRQRAVEALGQLGAKDVLMEYLSQKRVIANAVVRFGEEAVQSTAARELGSWRTEEVFQFVMDFAQHKLLTGVVDALREFRRPEALPLYLKVLENDVCRSSAEEAIRDIAASAKPVLLQATRKIFPGEQETPSQRQRRRSVVRILTELELTPEDWNQLQPLLRDKDKEIAVMAGEMGLDWGPPEQKVAAAEFLIRSVEWAHWFLQIRIRDCLNRNYPTVRELIETQIALRRLVSKKKALTDPVLRILERIQSIAESSRPKEAKQHGK
jgi:HEAT repeat protein